MYQNNIFKKFNKKWTVAKMWYYIWCGNE